MKQYKDMTTGEIWTEDELREIFEQLQGELDWTAGFDEYMTDRLHNGWMEEVRV